jgi:hypothetical protein
MTKKTIKEIIESEVTISHALRWYESTEKLLHFDYGFNSRYLELSCTNDGEKFDYALELFEDECERLTREDKLKFIL